MTTPYTILAQDLDTLLRLVQRPHITVLQQFSLGHDCQQVALNDVELQTFLRALPPETVRQALGRQTEGRDSWTGWEATRRIASLQRAIRESEDALGHTTTLSWCAQLDALHGFLKQPERPQSMPAEDPNPFLALDELPARERGGV